MTTDSTGDLFAGLAVLISVITAFIMWLQYREARGADSTRVKIEKQGLLAIQLNTVMRRLEGCEKRHADCEEKYNRLEQKYSELRDDYYILLRRFATNSPNGEGGTR